MTAGTDNHLSPAPVLYGVLLEKRLTSIDDYVKIILEKGRIGLHVPKERFALSENAEPDERHVAYLLDKNEKDTVFRKQWMSDN